MTTAEARALIAHPSLGQGAAQTWADLGCGRGTFTRALASLLPGGSTIHAVDTDRAALDALPGEEHGISIVAHAADVTAVPWPFDGLDGVLMANSLHFLRNQDAFLTRLVAAMPKPMLILVEYDTDARNPWVPFPLSRQSASLRLAAAGFMKVIDLGRRASALRRAAIYAVLATRD